MGTPPYAAETRRGTSGAQVALVVVILIAVLVALWFFFLRDGDDTAETVAPAPTTAPAPTPTEAPEPAGKPNKGPVETFELFAPRDPFEPLVSEGTGGAGTATGGAAGGGGTGAGGTEAPGGGFAGGGAGGVGGHRVRLVDVFRQNGNQRAQVQVDGTVYTVDEGERFAQNFQLLSTSGDCATMLFGDDQFTLCEGEEILK